MTYADAGIAFFFASIACQTITFHTPAHWLHHQTKFFLSGIAFTGASFVCMAKAIATAPCA